MRSRVMAAISVLFATLVAAPAGGAAADPAHCSGWNTHPDRYSVGDFSFGNGTAIRRGPYTNCDRLGLGYPGHGIDVHCAQRNTNGVVWIFVRDTTTGVNGWADPDALRYEFEVAGPIPLC
ncbi:hypothetical protein JQN72_11770 [Phycicoccus sp. CSK15P-2]|uniref:hypothetical protein n=1 Tax=Phycicoccus sp. CSK15P-2 TaxID=2807627 RepID=UPI001950FBDE|nr:hypothetical protein [Phycicoccus sp. CSK15P-2]MBM6404920.1 hypothetical protein [Phycicoccus sp. CSK15P-2]